MQHILLWCQVPGTFEQVVRCMLCVRYICSGIRSSSSISLLFFFPPCNNWCSCSCTALCGTFWSLRLCLLYSGTDAPTIHTCIPRTYQVYFFQVRRAFKTACSRTRNLGPWTLFLSMESVRRRLFVVVL